MWVAAKLAFYYPMAASDNNQTGLYVFVRILHTGFLFSIKNDLRLDFLEGTAVSNDDLNKVRLYMREFGSAGFV